MNKTKIDWADYAWNPVTGCTKVSEGCRHCYAERHAKRFWGERKFTDVMCHEDRLGFPQTIKKPSIIFVNSMSDLFHEDVPTWFIEYVMVAIGGTRGRRHKFIILTKRPKRMQEFLNTRFEFGGLNNVIYGVSVEDQKTADERIPILLETNVKNKMISVEPMIGAVNLDKAGWLDVLDWVIVGGESGPGARPMQLGWAAEVKDQCKQYKVPFFFKQWGEFDEFGIRVGRAAAGHLLRGVEYHEYPKGFFMGEREE